MGHREEDAAPLKLTVEQHDVRSESEVVSSSRRGPKWLALATVGLVVALVVATVSADGDSSRRGSATSTSTTESPAVSEVNAQRQTGGGAYLSGRPEQVLEAARGTLVVLGSEGRDWRVLDPSSGWVEELPALQGVDPELATPVVGGLLVSKGSFIAPSLVEVLRPGPDVAQRTRAGTFAPDVSHDLFEFVGVLGVGGDAPPDRVWVVSAPRGPQSESALQATLVDRPGQRLRGPLALPGPPRAANEVGLILNAGGRSFLVSADGTSDLGVGTVAAAAGGYAGRVVCDADLSCVQEAVDVSTAEVVAGSPFPSDAAARSVVTMAQAPDGSIASLPARVGIEGSFGGPSTTLYVTWRDGRAMQTMIDNPRSAPVWLSGSKELLILTGLGLVKIAEADGTLSATRVPNLNAQDATAVFVLTSAGQ